MSCPYNAGVDCNSSEIHCERCGWNPAVAEERKRTGKLYPTAANEKEKRMLELYNTGLSDYKVAQAMGIDRGVVYRWRVRNSLPSNQPHYDWALAAELHSQGKTDAEIAEVLGCDAVKVANWRRKQNL